MATMFVSLSMFVSCKDYDDDINALEQKNVELTSKIASLESSIAANKTTCETNLAAAKAELQAAINEVSGDVTSLQSLISAAQTAATEAGTKAAAAETAAAEAKAAAESASSDAAAAAAKAEAAQAAADAAAKTAADALAAAQKALEQAGASADVTALVSRVTALETKTANLAQLDTDVKALKTAVANAVTKEDLEKLGLTADGFQKYFDSLCSMVTSVSLYKSNGTDANYAQTGHDLYKLIFTTVTEKENTFPATAGVADKQYTFKEGDTKTYTADLVVRVSPTTASLDSTLIHLINAQGEELDDFITCANAEPYTTTYVSGEEYPTTRAAVTSNSGLWKLTFRLKNGYDPEAFKAAVTKENGGTDYCICFAVAIQNTEFTEDDNRRVVSEYDVIVSPEDAKTVTGLVVSDIEGKYVSIAEIHNRYTATETEWKSTTDNEEMVWLDNSKPATAAVKTGTGKNVKLRAEGTTDDRQLKALLPVEFNKDINIVIGGTVKDGTVVTSSINNNGIATAATYTHGGLTAPTTKIKGFYVTLDNANALESGNSEYNAWNGYSYENVGTETTPATLIDGNSGTIKITKMNRKNDIIGFRVYAVNLDGTLLDPDGQAFYVVVGNAILDADTYAADVTTKVAAAGSESEFIELSDNVFPKHTKFLDSNYSGVASTDNPARPNGTATGINVTDETTWVKPTFTVKYYAEDKETELTSATDIIEKAKYVKFVTNNIAGDYVNNATYTQTLTLYDKDAEGGASVKIKDIVFQMTKKVPTTCAELKLHDETSSNGVDIYAMVFPNPTAAKIELQSGWPGATFATEGEVDFTEIFSNLDGTDTNYAFSLSDADYDADGKVIAKEFGSTYDPKFDAYFIDSKVKTLSYTYQYNDLNTYQHADGTWTVRDKKYDADGAYVEADPLIVPGVKTYTTKLSDWHHNSAFSTLAWTDALVKAKTNQLQWDANTPFTNKELKLTNTKDITNSFNNTYLTMNLGEMLTVNGANSLLKAYGTPKLINTKTKEETTYATVKWNATNDGFIFDQVTGSTIQTPQANVSCNVVFNVQDGFGHILELSLPVTILKQ